MTENPLLLWTVIISYVLVILIYFEWIFIPSYFG